MIKDKFKQILICRLVQKLQELVMVVVKVGRIYILGQELQELVKVVVKVGVKVLVFFCLGQINFHCQQY
jgi:hypothetical protein